ncbi:MAG: nucleotidyl transferase AbiEii/AbiGii toxin family protein [Nanoarchaeota archaeon]
MIPLILRLKKASHKEIALGQDIIIKELYAVFERAVLHGGTGIWRCYHGTRFSEDIDVYIPRDLKKIDVLFNLLQKKGFTILKKRIREQSLYSTLQFNRVEIRFEALFLSVSNILKDYETVDGQFLPIYTLSPELFVKEKVAAYLSRKKIRDLYDIFFLMPLIQDKKFVFQELSLLIQNFIPAIDEEDLRVFILEGVAPTSEDMLASLKRWL